MKILSCFIIVYGFFFSPLQAWADEVNASESPYLTESFDKIPVFTAHAIKTFPHDTAAFTQGLVFADNCLYESTGLNGKSSLRRVDLETGKIVQIKKMPLRYYGEGLTMYKDTLVQLTWLSGTGFVYDRKTFDIVRTFTYPGEGWGITLVDEKIFMSDGTSELRILDPDSLYEIGRIDVRAGDVRVDNLNELEYVKGKIYANIWKKNRIAKINPVSGQVVGWIDLHDLADMEKNKHPVNVLNGIAYDLEADRLFVTGKRWGRIYEIRLTPYKSDRP
ncbi:MAG: glutaminyl-peptide cyclotransferase [Desulfobulbaceae bacterium]|nr:glutaminyl-peptide cyclotransferase [Desulfobulbaceae bacterium]